MIAIEKHITFLQKDYPLDAKGFAAQLTIYPLNLEANINTYYGIYTLPKTW